MGKSRRRTIVVYGASSPKALPVYTDAAYRLGRLLAESGRSLVTGAGRTGLMAAVENGALEHGGTVTGVIPQFMVDNGWMHPGLTKVIVTPGMHQRKKRMSRMAHAVVALPGGTGTFEELFEIITWKMLGLFIKPVIILNTDHYYDPILTMLRSAVDQKFMSSRFTDLWSVAETPEQVIELIDSIPEWDCSECKI